MVFDWITCTAGTDMRSKAPKQAQKQKGWREQANETKNTKSTCPNHKPTPNDSQDNEGWNVALLSGRRADAMPPSLGSYAVIGCPQAVLIAAVTALIFCRQKETTKKGENFEETVRVHILPKSFSSVRIGILSPCRSHSTRYTRRFRRSGECLRGFMKTVEMRRDCTGPIQETIEWLGCTPRWSEGGIHTVCFFAHHCLCNVLN